jgi:predicted alpha/beta superfamily hydrolase
MNPAILRRPACALLILLGPALTSAAAGVDEKEGLPILLGRAVRVQSEILGESRQILVRVPCGYDNSPQRFPVLFVLDGEYHFLHVSGIVQFLSTWGAVPQVGLVPDMIVVGVVNADRGRDLTPAADPDAPHEADGVAGPSARFMRFVKEELIPFVDEKYRTVPFRVLAGHGLAGSFTLHGMLAEPGLFQGYIAVSPALHGKAQVPLATLPQALSNRAPHPAFLFLATGRQDQAALDAIEDLADALRRHAPRSLRWEQREYAETGHGTEVHKAVYDGLTRLFEGWRLPDDVQARGPGAVEAHYAALSEQYGFEVPVPEFVWNTMGYQLLWQKRTAEAIDVFRRNVAAYPRSWNVYDSLGEAYMIAGQTELAIRLYEKSITLNPYNLNGERMLARLRTAEPPGTARPPAGGTP